MEKILFIAEGQMGDLLLLTPAIRGVYNSISSKIDILINQRRGLDSRHGSKDILFEGKDNVLSTNPYINKIFIFDHASLKNIKGIKKLFLEFDIIRTLRKEKYDKIICTFPNDRFIIWSFFSGAAVRAGQKDQPFSFLLTDKSVYHKEDEGVLKYYLSLTALIGSNSTSDETEFIYSKDALGFAKEFLAENNLEEKNFICIHPGASGNYKIWPPENFAKLIDNFSSAGITTVLCTSKWDQEPVDQIISICTNSPVIFYAPKNVEKMAALFSLCGLVITNDSGPRHLAAASKARSLAIFRVHNDKAWKVYPENNMTATIKSEDACPVCPLDKCLDKLPDGEKFGSFCMRLITIEKVKQRALELFALGKNDYKI